MATVRLNMAADRYNNGPLREYSRIPVTRTLHNSNLPPTRRNLHLPSDRFLYNFTLDNSNFFLFPSLTVRIIGSYLYLQIVFYIILPSITRTPDNSNFCLFPLKVRIIGSQLYLQILFCIILPPITRTFFYFPWRFELLGVNCSFLL